MRKAHVGRFAQAAVIAAALLLLKPPTIAVFAGVPDFVPKEVDPRVVGAEPRGITVARGVIADAAGKGTAGSVALVAWPNEAYFAHVQVGDMIPTPTVGWAQSQGNGFFSVRLDTEALGSDFRADDGTVNLTAYAWDSNSEGAFSFSTRLDAAGNPKAIEDLGDVKLDRGLAKSDTVAVVSPGSALAVVIPCGWATVQMFPAWTVIGATWPWGSDTGWMKSVNTHSMTLGAASSSKGDTTYSYSASGTSSVTSGVTFEWPESVAFLDYRVQIEYQKLGWGCGGGPGNPFVFDGKNYWVRPSRSLGFRQTTYNPPQPSWPAAYCGPMSAGKWTKERTTSDAYELNVGVKVATFIGINLSSKSSYGATHSQMYRLTQNGKMCGDTDVPEYSRNAKTTR